MKKKVMAIVHFEVDAPEGSDFGKLAAETLDRLLPPSFKIQIYKSKVNRKKIKQIKLQTLGEFTPEEVFAHLTNDENRVEFKIGEQSHFVRMNSHRYFVFQHSLACVACGLKGEKFVLQQHPYDKSPHFNLYAIEDNELILMTKDHIYAKSQGGGDYHSNFQTMCSICNNLKSSHHIPVAGIYELRKLYNENKNILTKKQFNAILNETRHRLSIPRPTIEEIKNDAIRVKFDVNVYGNEEALIGMALYEKPEGTGWQHLGCIRKGSVVAPIEIKDKKLVLPFGDRTFELYQGLTNYLEVDSQTQNSVV